jgi:cystathionine gamma-synthase
MIVYCTDMEDPKKRPAAATQVVHAGEPRSRPEHALTTPVFQTATYVFDQTADLIRFMEGEGGRVDYGRYGNPTVRLVETKIAELEGGEDAVAFASGMAALVTTCMAFTRSGAVVS